MDCDLQNFRLIETPAHTIAVFRPNDEQGRTGIIPIIVFKDVKIPEAESVLLHAGSRKIFPISLDTKVGIFHYNIRTHLPVHGYDDMKPFKLFDSTNQQMRGRDQLDAIDDIRKSYASIKLAVREMKPGFSSKFRATTIVPSR